MEVAPRLTSREVPPEAIELLKSGKPLPRARRVTLDRVVERNVYRLLKLQRVKADVRVRSLASPVSISNATIHWSPAFTYNDVFFFTKKSVPASWTSTFTNARFRPVRFTYEVRGKDEKKTKTVVLKGHQSINEKVDFKVSPPEKVPCSSAVRGFMVNDSVSKTYPAGLAVFRLKPVEEFPVNVEGVKNYENWNYHSFMEPLTKDLTELLNEDARRVGINFDYDITIGGIRVNDIYYPTPEVRLDIAISITNNTDYDLQVCPRTGINFFVDYEDRNRFTAYYAPWSDVRTGVAKGRTWNHRLSATLPSWAYGEVYCQHQVNIYVWWEGKWTWSGLWIGHYLPLKIGTLYYP